MGASSNEVTVYGAGMSGLIAAINLARNGYSVTVHDREPSYGGSQQYNPSTHVTPIDPVETSRYIGIDVSPAFHQVARPIPFYFHDTKVNVPSEGFFAVERGDRSTSLDTLLYGECEKVGGITFEWNSPLKKEDLGDLPPNTVIACGLTPSVYKMLDIPYLPWYAWCSRGESGVSDYAWIWWDEGISEYGYLSSVNEYYFNLLFSRKDVSKETLRKYKSFMVRNEGIEHENWDYISGVVPVGSPDNPRLFWNGAVLAGTISGAMDPWFWFGISGALVTGKVAALAVSDKEAAVREFERFTRMFKYIYAVKNKLWYPYFRPNVGMHEKMLKTMGIEFADRMNGVIAKQAVAGRLKVELVPGFGPYNVS